MDSQIGGSNYKTELYKRLRQWNKFYRQIQIDSEINTEDIPINDLPSSNSSNNHFDDTKNLSVTLNSNDDLSEIDEYPDDLDPISDTNNEDFDEANDASDSETISNSETISDTEDELENFEWPINSILQYESDSDELSVNNDPYDEIPNSTMYPPSNEDADDQIEYDSDDEILIQNNNLRFAIPQRKYSEYRVTNDPFDEYLDESRNSTMYPINEDADDQSAYDSDDELLFQNNNLRFSFPQRKRKYSERELVDEYLGRRFKYAKYQFRKGNTYINADTTDFDSDSD